LRGEASDIDPSIVNAWIVLPIALVLGACLGSFLNVVIDRLPVMLARRWRAEAEETLEVEPDGSDEVFNLAVPRSRCEACGVTIKAWQNVPVLSWLLLRGRCRSCQAPISVRLPAVEAAGGFLVLAVILAWGYTLPALAFYILLMALLALAVIDFETQLLPDEITLPLLWIGLLAALVFEGAPDGSDAVIGAAAGYLALWLIYWSHKLITRREGMGYGDFKLLAAIGAWLGWQMLPAVILVASLLGLGYASIGLVRGTASRTTPIPFGPFLAVGGGIALFFGRHLPPFAALS